MGTSTARSLALTLDRLNRRAEASNILTKSYSLFTKGFDNADLKDKALLNELSQ
jgi:hypothetical protein